MIIVIIQLSISLNSNIHLIIYKSFFYIQNMVFCINQCLMCKEKILAQNFIKCKIMPVIFIRIPGRSSYRCFKHWLWMWSSSFGYQILNTNIKNKTIVKTNIPLQNLKWKQWRLFWVTKWRNNKQIYQSTWTYRKKRTQIHLNVYVLKI